MAEDAPIPSDDEPGPPSNKSADLEAAKAYRLQHDKAKALGISPDSPEFLALNSPLNEAEPESIDELFSRIDKKLVQNMPREIAAEDIEKTVAWLIDRRKFFVAEQQAGVKTAKTKAAAAPKKPRAKNIAEALNIQL